MELTLFCPCVPFNMNAQYCHLFVVSSMENELLVIAMESVIYLYGVNDYMESEDLLHSAVEVP